MTKLKIRKLPSSNSLLTFLDVNILVINIIIFIKLPLRNNLLISLDVNKLVNNRIFFYENKLVKNRITLTV